MTAPAPPPASRVAPAGPKLSLEEYLHQREANDEQFSFDCSGDRSFRQMLNEAAVGSGVADAHATAVRPSGTNSGNAGNLPTVGVNLYLYQVMPNVAFRNTDTPTRRSDGTLLQPSRSAYDLNYLLTFYGNDGELEPHRILGNVLRELHTEPVLTRQRWESVKKLFTPLYLPFLTNSNVDTEIETIKLICCRSALRIYQSCGRSSSRPPTTCRWLSRSKWCSSMAWR